MHALNQTNIATPHPLANKETLCLTQRLPATNLLNRRKGSAPAMIPGRGSTNDGSHGFQPMGRVCTPWANPRLCRCPSHRDEAIRNLPILPIHVNLNSHRSGSRHFSLSALESAPITEYSSLSCMIVKLKALEGQATRTAARENTLRLNVARGVVRLQNKGNRTSADLHPIAAKPNGNHSL